MDVKFPIVIYKKLLNESIGLDDLKELDPELYKNLKYILEYKEENLEEVLYCNFIVEYECFSEKFKHELKENGENIFVN